ncbi:hypothetical protein CCAX7_23250 [Capsulimonas corticalis]|uniref:Uncharacterized protein n=1 Tax=Capsulimonas corticalis TaxID=2219043 RepID=A0A402CV48_9BACT|nr:AraC family transcriptional regulator [Capsulimonas corticalis]BDI30274.1 hypothetical protein CCAX7_23250 [Capsulimonas corticalis]
MQQDNLSIPFQLPLTGIGGAGMFVSPGQWRHGDRVIDDYVVMFVRTGVLHMQEDGREFDVRPNETLLLAPGRKHGGVSHDAQSLSYFWMHFHLDNSDCSEGLSLLNIPQHATIPRPERLEALFRLLIGDQLRKTTSELSRKLLACCILSEVAQDAAVHVENDDSKVVANQACAFIHTRFTEPISASDVAAAVSCNPKYLARVFREVYHETMTQYIQNLRIEHAQHLLLQTNMTVNEIALACGFMHVTYFIKIFRESTAMTPNAYRRNYGLLLVTTY